MSARIGQRAPSDIPIWWVYPTVARGATAVDVGEQVWRFPIRDGFGQLAAAFTTPASIPGSGGWTITIPELVGFSAQDIGTILVGDTVSVAHLSAGVISTVATIAASTRVTIRGTVTV